MCRQYGNEFTYLLICYLNRSGTRRVETLVIVNERDCFTKEQEGPINENTPKSGSFGKIKVKLKKLHMQMFNAYRYYYKDFTSS